MTNARRNPNKSCLWLADRMSRCFDRYASETQTIVTAADCPTPTIAGPGAAATGTDSNAVDAGVGVDPSLVAVGRKQDVAV